MVAETESTEIKNNDDTGTDDLDDGLDIDEAGDGNLFVVLKDVKTVDNFDDTLDLEEAGEGYAEVEMMDTIASRNVDQGVKVDEEGAGYLSATIEDSNGYSECKPGYRIARFLDI